MSDINEKQFVHLCVRSLGQTIEGLQTKGKNLGLSIDDQRRIWRQILTKTTEGGGKFVPGK